LSSHDKKNKVKQQNLVKTINQRTEFK